MTDSETRYTVNLGAWCWDLHARTADEICPPPF